MRTPGLGLILFALGSLGLGATLASAQQEQEEKALWQPYYISLRSGAQHLSLAGNWELGYRDVPIASLEDLGQQLKWVSALVPSSVQWTLYRAGELPHPYYHLNSKKYTWVPDKIWYYRRQFQVPASAQGRYVFLCFDGVGYNSRIWLNGELLGRHEGMFGGPAVEVSKVVRIGGPNELLVEVRAPSYGMQNWDAKSLESVIVPWGIGGGNTYVTGNSGIGTKEFLPFGIWRDVRLEIVPRIHLERPFLVTKEANGREARLTLTAEVMVNTHSLNFQLHPWKDAMLGEFRNAWTSTGLAAPLGLQIQFLEKGGAQPVLTRTFPLQVFEGRNWIKQEIRMPSPKLWWPNGMGTPSLYQVKVALISEGRPIDHLQFDFGIRTIRQRPSAGPRTQDRWADWQFVVNGRPLFVKGVMRVRNTGSKPAFLTQLNIKGTKRAFYGSDNFFWLAPGEMRSLDFRVLWRDPATRDRAVLTVHAWNAPATQVAIPAR